MSPKIFNQVRYRLLFLIVLAALPGLLLLIAIAKQQWKVTEDVTRENALRVARESIKLTKQQIADATSLLQELSQNPAIQNQDVNACQTELSKRLQQLPQYVNFGVVNSDGEVYCSAVPLSQSVNIGDRFWFQRLSQTRTPTVGQFQISSITQTPIVPIGHPIFNKQGQLTSAIFASLNLELLNPSTIQKLPPNTTLTILDPQGVILARHPNPEQWVGKSMQDSALFQELTGSQGDAVTIATVEGADGNLRLFAFSRLTFEQASTLYVAIGIPDALIQEQVVWIMGRYTLLIVLPTLLILGLAWYIANKGIQHPILLLTNVARQLATGDLTARTELPAGSGEFSQLAVAYNTMATELEHYINQRVAVQKDREIAELKNQFVAMVTHELRNPLMVVRGSAELLELFNEAPSTDQRQKHLGRIQDAVDHMTHLMEEILLLGRAESGEIAFSPIALNPSDFCRDLVDELRLGIAQERTIVFSSKGECAEAPLDVNLLRSILTNLLTNAIKYSPAASRITFNLECQSDRLILQIKDEGIGIPAADQAHLFEAFHRARNVGRVSGTGLGLAIVKRCVDIHGGDISFESVEGEGTTFLITLPRL